MEEQEHPIEPAKEAEAAVMAAEAEPVVLDDAAIADLQMQAAKADEYLDLAQRTKADFENFRKRMTRDLQAAEARGTGRLAKELLPALDNLERALAAVESSEADEEHHMTQGFRLVQSELGAALNRTGIQGFVPRGEPFDPSEHEAVAQQPVEGTPAGTVVEVLQSGYRLNGAILRPARVIVAG
jgi:molecular chaperone GrpE